jgi:hypothetical protein
MATVEEVHTVRVSNVSPKATEHDIQDFFSFSGEIEHIELHKDGELSQTAFVTFKEAQALETALLLSGATVVDQAVTIAPAHESERLARSVDTISLDAGSAESTEVAPAKPVTKSAQEAFQNMLEKGYVLHNNTMSKAKVFDDKHQLTANASQLAANAQAKVVSIDNKIGITQKFSAGTAAINQQVKAVDEKYHVAEKARAAVQATEQKLNAAGSAIAKNRYILTGTSWVAGAYAKVAKTAEEVGQKTFERVATLSSGDQKSPRTSSPSSASEGYFPPPPYPADDPAPSPRVSASPPTPVESDEHSQTKPVVPL